MNNKVIMALIVVLIVCQIGLFFSTRGKKEVAPVAPPQEIMTESPLKVEDGEPEPKLEVTAVPARDLSFDEIKTTLEAWHKERPEITEMGVVGMSDAAREIPYIRIGKKTGPKVLIMSTIHGNERLCASVTMTIFGDMLKGYGTDDRVTKMLDGHDVFFIPVASPDGYIAKTREVKNLDPNRQFNGPNMTERSRLVTVESIKEFYNKHKFVSVMSCHNFGQVYFYPWGHTSQPTQQAAQYSDFMAKMSQMSGYRAHQLYGRSYLPYYGFECDWFHSQGAFAFVNEIGTVFMARPTEIADEVKKNYESFLYFIEQSPVLKKVPAPKKGISKFMRLNHEDVPNRHLITP